MNSHNHDNKHTGNEKKILSDRYDQKYNDQKYNNLPKELNIITNQSSNNYFPANKNEDLYKSVKNKNFTDLKLNEYNFFEPFNNSSIYNINNINTLTNQGYLANNNPNYNKSFHVQNNSNYPQNKNTMNSQNHDNINNTSSINNYTYIKNNINNNNPGNINAYINPNQMNHSTQNLKNTLKISSQSLSNLDLKIMNENNIEILADLKNERIRNSNVFSNHSNQNNIESDSFNIYSNSSNNTNNAFVSNSSANNMNSTHPASNQSNNNNSNLILENLTTEELKTHLENAKRIYEKKLSETENLIKEINSKDVRISELTLELKGLLETEFEIDNTVANNNIVSDVADFKNNFNKMNSLSNIDHINNINNLDNINLNNFEFCTNNSNNKINDNSDAYKKCYSKEKEIYGLTLEISNIKRNHSDLIKQIEKEYDKELELNLNRLKENYEKKINEISEEQDKKIKELQQEIHSIKLKIDKYESIYMNKNFPNSNQQYQFNTLYNSTSSINYNNHNYQDNSLIINQPNQYLLNLKKEHDEELLEYEKEIGRLECIIKDNLKITSEADNSNFLNFANIPYYNQNTMENYDIISMISQLETPTNAMQTNEKFNFKNINFNDYNNKNSNAFNVNDKNNPSKCINPFNNQNTNMNNLQETEIIDYSKPSKNNLYDYNHIIENNILTKNKNFKDYEKIKYSTIQQKKTKVKHINNFSLDEDMNEDYWICDEVGINKINNLKMENTIKDRISLASLNPDFN